MPVLRQTQAQDKKEYMDKVEEGIQALPKIPRKFLERFRGVASTIYPHRLHMQPAEEHRETIFLFMLYFEEGLQRSRALETST
jgi:hypothetical protein